MIDLILRAIEANFDISYMIVVNVLTYLAIKLADKLNGDKYVPTCLKRLILIAAMLLVGFIYYIMGYPSMIVLLNSAILAPVFWGWLAYPILKHFNLGYVEDIASTMTIIPSSKSKKSNKKK